MSKSSEGLASGVESLLLAWAGCVQKRCFGFFAPWPVSAAMVLAQVHAGPMWFSDKNLGHVGLTQNPWLPSEPCGSMFGALNI